MEIKCEYIDKDSGCLVSFDGSCCKEECFTYRLIKHQEYQLKPFQDEYFKGLDNVAIAELAKKSIQLTTENRKLENTLDEIEKYCTYMNTFNKYNKTNKGLVVDEVLDIINKAKDGE